MKRICEPQVLEGQTYYFAFHSKGEQALKRRRNLESLRSQKKRNEKVISEFENEKKIDLVFYLNPYGQIFEQIAHNDLEKNKEIIIDVTNHYWAFCDAF